MSARRYAAEVGDLLRRRLADAIPSGVSLTEARASVTRIVAESIAEVTDRMEAADEKCCPAIVQGPERPARCVLRRGHEDSPHEWDREHRASGTTQNARGDLDDMDWWTLRQAAGLMAGQAEEDTRRAHEVASLARAREARIDFVIGLLAAKKYAGKITRAEAWGAIESPEAAQALRDRFAPKAVTA